MRHFFFFFFFSPFFLSPSPFFAPHRFAREAVQRHWRSVLPRTLALLPQHWAEKFLAKFEPYAQIKIGTRCGTRAPAAAETTMPQHLVPLTGSRDGQAHRLTPGEGRETFIFFSKMLLGETSSDQEAPEAA